MQTQELTIKRREGTGKQVAKRLRRSGVVPAVLYGGAKLETVAVDPRAVPTSLSFNPNVTAPPFQLRSTDFWAQGLTFGLDWRY